MSNPKYEITLPLPKFMVRAINDACVIEGKTPAEVFQEIIKTYFDHVFRFKSPYKNTKKVKVMIMDEKTFSILDKFSKKTQRNKNEIITFAIYWFLANYPPEEKEIIQYRIQYTRYTRGLISKISRVLRISHKSVIYRAILTWHEIHS